MKNRPYKYLAVLIMCAVAAAFIPDANAQYPEKPIELAVHSSPGGGSDMFARAMGLFLEKEGIVKQKIRVVNRTGGSGTVCMDYLNSKRGDPYVISAISAAPLSSVIRKISALKYEELTFLAMMVMDANVVCAKYDAPYNDMKELVAHFKKSGNEVNVAIGSLGGMDHLGAYRTGKATGLKFNIISFKSSGGSAIALLGGHADIRVGAYTESLDPKAKQAKILAITSEERNPFFPDVPTLKEQGIDVTGCLIRGFWAPPDCPPYAVKYWETALGKLVKTKAFKDYSAKSFGIINFMTGKELRTWMDTFTADMERDLKALGLFDVSQKK
jgi:putative tricarboxylic transport membrane protein